MNRATPSKQGPLLVVDGNSFAHRAYHGLPKTIRRTGGKGAGAVLGFANFLLKFYAPRNHGRCWWAGIRSTSRPTGTKHCRATNRAASSRRAVEQLGVLPEFVSACGFANAKAAGYEADDFLAAAVAKEEKRGGMAVVATGDRDAFQLASARTIILQPVKAGELARIGPAEVLQRYGVEPHQVPDFIALRGDASDRIPGALGRRTQDRRGPAAPPRLVGGLAQGWPL